MDLRVPAADAVTRVLAGRYRLTAALGRGGMGTVWRADDDLLGRAVAVKELSLPRGVAPDRRAMLCERAIREARVASRLRHGSIIRVHDVIAEDDRPWIVMELLTGRSLDDAGPLPPREAAEIGLAVLDALGVAHAHGVLHRDVKPGNVFRCDDGRVVLTDFGIATLDGDVSLTGTGGLVGSPGYMAPERLRGDTAGPPSDLWSLGATLYAATEGRPPFARRTVAGTLSAVLTEEPAPPHRAGPLGPLIAAMLAKDPARRPPPEAVRAFLRGVAGGETPAPEAIAETGGMPATPSRPVRRHRRRGPRLAVLAAASACAVAVPAGFLLAGHDRTEGPVRTPDDPGTGRFASLPDPCSLVTSAEATRLGVRARATAGERGCRWGEGLGGGGSLEVRLQRFAPRAGAGAPDLAEAYYADKRRQLQVSAHTSDRIHSTQSGVTDVPGTADAAFVYDGTDGIGAGRSSTVWLRSSNLVVEVVFADLTGALGAARLHQNALAAARAVGTRLGRL
jgi:eukaryotic-like serine/threonine-protein kinase